MTTATANKVKAPKKGFKLDRQMIPTLAAVVIFILMIIMGQALFGTYIRLGFISSLFIDHAYLIILAVAMTLPILTGGIDLSVGAIVAITAVVGLKLANAGVPAFLVMIIMLLIGAVFGLLAGTLIEEFNMQPFIATLSTMFLARGLASIISTDSLTFPQGNDFSFISNVIKIIDNPKISNDLSFNVGVIIALVVVVFGYVFLHHTRTGRTIYAIGGSRSSAELMGLPVKRTQYIIYLTSATLAALASIVYTANIGSAKNTVGVGWELDAVASVVIGGTIITGGFGYVLGSVLGSLVRSILDPLTSDFGVPAEWTTIVIGLMILVFVVLQRAVMAVGGDKERRHGIVLAKNMLAKAKGVKTAEALWEAERKCPGIKFVPPHFERYANVFAPCKGDLHAVHRHGGKLRLRRVLARRDRQWPLVRQRPRDCGGNSRARQR